MKVLCVTNLLPAPSDSGGAVRIRGLVASIAARHDVALLARSRPEATDTKVAAFSSETGVAVEQFGDRTGDTAARRWMRALAVGAPPYMLTADVHGLVALARRHADADVVVLLDDYAGLFIEPLRSVVDAPVVLDKHNVFSASLRSKPKPRSPRVALYNAVERSLVDRFESRSVHDASAVTVTSENEALRLFQFHQRRPSAVVPSGIDLPTIVRAPDGTTVLWIGQLLYDPNVEGLLRFVEAGLPALEAAGGRLVIVGPNPPADVQRLANRMSVEVMGFVDDLDPVFSRSTVAVVPLWRGAGVKLKTLLVMGAGIPTVTTSLGAEGVNAVDGRHCLIRDDAEALGRAVGELLDGKHQPDFLGAEGSALIRSGYSIEATAADFVCLVEKAGSARGAETDRLSAVPGHQEGR